MTATMTSMLDFENGTDVSLNAMASIILYANTLMIDIPTLPVFIKNDIKNCIAECNLIMQKIAEYPIDLASYDWPDDKKEENDDEISGAEVGEFLTDFIETLDSCLEEYGTGPAFAEDHFFYKSCLLADS